MRKIIIFGLCALSLFFATNVKAVVLSTFKATTTNRNTKIGELVNIEIYSTSDGVLNPDTTAFVLDYDESVFQYVSYKGIGNTYFEAIEHTMYVDWQTDGSSTTDISNNQLIGTLVLKVNEKTDDTTSTISYETFYENQLNTGTIIFNIGNSNDTPVDNNVDDDIDNVTDINVDDDIDNATDINVDNDIDTTIDDNKGDVLESNSNDNNLSKTELIFIIVVGILSLLMITYIIITNKKIKNLQKAL